MFKVPSNKLCQGCGAIKDAPLFLLFPNNALHPRCIECENGNIPITVKQCSKCKIIKNIDGFWKAPKRVDGFRNQCIECNQKYNEENKEEIKLLQKVWYEINKEEILIDRKIYNIENEDILKEYRQSHKEEIKIYNKKYREDNSDKIKDLKRSNQKERLSSDPVYKLRHYASNQVRTMLQENGASKSNKSILNFLPYSMEDLKVHIENQFEQWMTWDNWSVYDPKVWDDNDPSTWKWQLDHIIPHSTFHYETMDCDEFRACWALSNLRPLNAKQNTLDGPSRIRH